MECALCLEDKTGFVTLGCGHCFCEECCTKYEEYLRRSNRAFECPMCRCVVEPRQENYGWHLAALVSAFLLLVVLLRLVAEI